MRFLIDMNLSPIWCDYLRQAGHDAVHWTTIGRPDAPDTDLMRWASDNDHVVITNDLDFGAMLAASGDQRPSVIQLRSDALQPHKIGAQLLRAVDVARPDLEAGALLTIDVAHARLRILPLTNLS